MNKLRNIQSNQITVFVISLIIFIIAATLGWQRLHYGFNFLDEGYHMTEAWRLTVGDPLFQDEDRGAIDFSPIINSFFFRINPDITVLGFRKIQYFFTIFSLLFFSIALFKIDKQFWYQPLVFSIFAFTGFDPVGFFRDLCYLTYPHLFIVLHLSFLLFGFSQQSVLVKRILFVLAGIFLWLISFNLLHLSLIVFSPILLFYFFRKWKIDYISFDYKDLCFVLAPVLLCWAFFLVTFNKAYVQNIFNNLMVLKSSTVHSPEALIKMNWGVLERLCIILFFLVTSLYCFLRFRFLYFIIYFSILSLAMYFIIYFSFFGLIAYPYDNVFNSSPMWFTCLLISAYIVFLSYIVWKIVTHRKFNKTDTIAIILLVPCIILAISSSVFSNSGLLTILHSSIPVVGAISMLILSKERMVMKSYPAKLLILLILFAPFYYSTAWSDWRNTDWDVFPENAGFEIERGVGKGIRTNQLYKDLYKWISIKAENNTQKDDYIISDQNTAMVHMITKRRSSFDKSYINYYEHQNFDFWEVGIEKMIESGREPKMAFLFDNTPILYTPSLIEPEYYWLANYLSSPSSNPIFMYVANHMSYLDQLRINPGFTVTCFVKK